MPPSKRKVSEVKPNPLDFGQGDDVQTIEPRPSVSKVVHITPENVIGSLNSAVAGINSVFQLRDQLQTEVNVLKEELSIGNDIRIESGRLDAIKREEEEFLYDYQIRKTRSERELKEMEDDQKNRLNTEEEEHANKLTSQAEEQKTQLKIEANAHALKLKQEREDHERRIKLEREDIQREQAQLAQEKTLLAQEQKKLEALRTSLKDELAKELNRDNAHAIEVLKLNHLKELELVRGELKLEQAHRVKFETLLKEAHEQNEKLSEQISSLSKEALSSASAASMAAKLKDLVSQMAGNPSRTN